MVLRGLRTLAGLTVLAAVLAGCATGTRVATFGPLPGGTSLLTLVVSDDLALVRRECAELAVFGRVLGCQASRPVQGKGPLPVRMVKIVRYAETLPSPTTFEIDAHELCHAVAALQRLDDPCHEGNDGMLQAHGVRLAAPPLR